ncbi:hypothetical protein SDC49_12990 [Lactobacillus sp. R2/2]|nr:hypothetical protein [Lactobacillus sp. R2/2]
MALSAKFTKISGELSKAKRVPAITTCAKSLKGLQIAEKLYKKRQTIEDLPSWVFQNFRAVNTCDNVTKYLNQT